MLNSAAPPTLALDIGNTRAHVGIIDTKHRTCLATTAFPVAEAEERLSPAIEALIGKAGVPVGKTVAIASVVREAGITIETQLRQCGYDVRQLTASSPLPFAISYENPHTLGADRIANALCAVTVYPGRPVVCISVGTAIVIDYIADTTFFGGAILPGIRLQLASLHLGTDALPDFGKAAPVEIPLLPGISTRDCMVGGVMRGAAAAICGIVAGYGKLQTDQRPFILSTGGDWSIVAPLVDFEYAALPDMTLIGTACSLFSI